MLVRFHRVTDRFRRRDVGRTDYSRDHNSFEIPFVKEDSVSEREEYGRQTMEDLLTQSMRNEMGESRIVVYASQNATTAVSVLVFCRQRIRVKSVEMPFRRGIPVPSVHILFAIQEDESVLVSSNSVLYSVRQEGNEWRGLFQSGDTQLSFVLERDLSMQVCNVLNGLIVECQGG